MLVDWNWQIGALMVAGVTLAAIPLSRGEAAVASDHGASRPERRRRLGGIVRLAATAVASVAAISVLAVALIAPAAVDASRESAARGDLAGAAAEAAEGESAASFASSPALQRALIEERAGRLAAAADAARRATVRTPDDWKAWFVLARVETQRGRTRSAVSAFREARKLNPNSKLLKP
jgi:Flp pilus assembly protein TadD